MIETTKHIVCDNCGAAGPYLLPGEIARDCNLHDLAKADGWRITSRDLCPRCAKATKPSQYEKHYYKENAK